jgi:hypothetical protein
MSGHVLTCRHCGRRFTTRRSDAIGCSRSCRRHLAKAARAPAPDPTARIPEGEARETPDELDGWRRLPGGLVAPPPDPRLTFRVD